MSRSGTTVRSSRPLPARARMLALAGMLIALVPAPALAEESAPPPASPANSEPAEYARAIDAAVAEHDAGRFIEARAHFFRAHEIDPNARTLRGLGMVEFELRNYGEAVNYLDQALSSQVKPLDAMLRRETEQLLARARAYVGEVHVAVDPGSATVIVDGVTVASGPEASFTLVVGDHELEFRAKGHLPERRAVRVRSGDQTSIRVVLDSPSTRAPEVAFATHEPASRSERKPLVRKWWLWTLVGAAVVGTAVGVSLAARADERVRTAPPERTPNTPPDLLIMTLGRP